jgi:hypothetical protein
MNEDTLVGPLLSTWSILPTAIYDNAWQILKAITSGMPYVN